MSRKTTIHKIPDIAYMKREHHKHRREREQELLKARLNIIGFANQFKKIGTPPAEVVYSYKFVLIRGFFDYYGFKYITRCDLCRIWEEVFNDEFCADNSPLTLKLRKQGFNV